MSLLNRLLRGHQQDSVLSAASAPTAAATPLEKYLDADEKRFIRKKATAPKFQRRCRVEELEKRELLAADPTLTLGGVILEQNEDIVMGDRFYVSWVSDVADTSLALQEVTIELGYMDGGTYGFFDTTADEPNGGNYDTGHDMFIVSGESDISLDQFDYHFTYADGHTDKIGNGATSLTIAFKNGVFTTDKKLVFEVDVDFVNYVNGSYYSTSNFEGADMEFAGVNFRALFTSDQYETLDTTLFYKDIYHIGGKLDIVDDICDDPFTDGGLNTTGVMEEIALDPKPVTISGYVYADVLKNCYFETDTGDYALEDVQLTLYYKTDTGAFAQVIGADGKAMTTQTDAGGYYEFADLDPGTYKVVSEADIYYGQVYGNDYYYYDSCARAQDNPISSDPLSLTTVELVGGSSSVRNNFGKVLMGTIAGNVYEDRNLNGKFDEGDIGISGVSVELYKLVDGKYVVDRTTTTASDGSYYFLNLDKETTYALHETQPADYRNAYNTPGYVGVEADIRGEIVTDDDFAADVRVIEGIQIGYFENGVENNFGEVKLFSISGYVYEDLDHSGTMTAGDAKISGVTVELYKLAGSDYELLATTQTSGAGYYEFNGLDLKEVYYVHEIQPSSYLNATNNVGTISGAVYGTVKTLSSFSDDDRLFEVDLTVRAGYGWNESGVQYNFGENRVNVSGYVYEDRDSSGTRSASDKGIASTRVELYKKVGSRYVFMTAATTDSDGYYIFRNLDVDGEYYIHEVQPGNYVNAENTVGSFNDASLGSIVSMTDYGDDVRVFSINLDAADKSDWEADETGIDYNFGETVLGSISGNVYQDRNDSGVKDSGDAGIGAVTVELYVWDGTQYKFLSETKTDAAGNYSFDGLDINEEYAVHEVQPKGYANRSNNVGTVNGSTVGRLVTDSSYSDDKRVFKGISLTWSGRDGVHYNFGEIKYGSISGYVFDVTDGRDPIADVTITLIKEDGKTVTTVTDEKGYYIFSGLEVNKTYTVTEEDLSAVYTHYGESVGNFDGETVGKSATRQLSSITIKWDDAHNETGDQDGVQYNFMEYIPEEPDPEPTPEGYNLDRILPLLLPNRYYGGPTSPFNYLPSSVTTAPVSTVRYGGGGAVSSYAWHLSVLNGGYPRSIEALTSTAGFRALYRGDGYAQVAWNNADLTRGQWLIRGNNGGVAQRYAFGTDEAVAVVGDWNGDGTDKLGLYVNGHWYLDRDGNGTWDEEDLWAELGGKAKDQPVAGDWDGDGKSDIGIFGPRWTGDELAMELEPGLPAAKNDNTFVNVARAKNIPPEYEEMNVNVRTMRHSTAGQTRVDLIDHVFEYGQEGDKAVTGDWNGDGISKIGVYNNGKWRIDVNGNGVWDDGDKEITGFGNENSVPVVGDFNGDGVDEIGLFENGFWALDADGDYRPDKTFEFGQAGDQPAVGDFNGDGKTEFSVYRNSGEAVQTVPAETEEL